MAKKSELRFEAPTAEKDIFFISDTHWYHSSIIRPEYSNRPFKDVEEMNEQLVANWNAAVRPQDVIFHLGDFAMTGPKKTIELIKRLNGRKYLVRGNHDLKIRDLPAAEELFEAVNDVVQIKVADPEACQGWQRITLCHYAMRTWNKAHYGAWNLYGHSHGNLDEPQNMRAMDVGVDATARRYGLWMSKPAPALWYQVLAPTDYRPISYAEVKAVMRTRGFQAVDHHTEVRYDDPDFNLPR